MHVRQPLTDGSRYVEWSDIIRIRDDIEVEGGPAVRDGEAGDGQKCGTGNNNITWRLLREADG